MVITDGVIDQSTMGGCTNYNPNKSRPTGGKARDIAGLVIHECLNCTPTDKGRSIGCSCGNAEYCSRYALKQRE